MKTTRIIEKYLDGTLNDEELKEFNDLIENDKEFRELLQLHKETNNAIADDAFFRLIEKLNKQYNQYMAEINITPDESLAQLEKGIKRFYYKWIVSVAAGFLLIAASVLTWYLLVHPENQSDQLFAEYYQLYEPDIISRNIENSAGAWQHALLLYKYHKWHQADSTFSVILSLDSTDTAALFYSGMIAVELNQYKDAIQKMQKVINIGDSGYKIHARWYLGLLYCKTNETEKAREALLPLVSSENYYSKKARKLLRRL